MKLTLVMVLMFVPIALTAGAQRGGGRTGGGAARTGGAASVNRDASRTSIRSTQDVNRNVTRNGDFNSVNRNVDVDRDINVNGNVYGGYDRWGHPIAAGAAMGVAAGVTAAALGSSVAVLPPSCSTVVVNGIGYSQCGSTWYQPYYSGTTVQYTVVNPPQ